MTVVATTGVDDGSGDEEEKIDSNGYVEVSL